MKKLYFLLVFVSFSLFCSRSFAQIVGGNVFLQGAYLEIGEDNMGAFGTCSSPAGYHPHDIGTDLGEVYDYGHDGWTVGTPPYMGDYTEPGDPVEGWGVQIGAIEYDNWVSGGSPCGGSFSIPGSVTGYSNSGGVITGTWTGTATGGLSIIAESRVDTLGSAVVITVRFYNTSLGPINAVFYERMCDPDNASTWSGSSYTNNVIVHQNEDAAHDVLVSSTADNPLSGSFTWVGNAPYTYMGLGTKDCRAVCDYFFTHDPVFGPADVGDLTPATGTMPAQWAMTGGGNTYALGDSDFVDAGIGLIFNLGNFAPAGSRGDSAVISFAYIFNGNPGLDAVFPDPQLLVEDSLLPNAPVPNPSFDTFDVCAHPGDDTVIVDILHATTGNWTWSHWTWAPSTGLTSTTGTVDTIISSVLPASITYTITGTDSSTGPSLNCQTRVFYLTILACNQCTNNSPCQGDSLLLFRKGDSTGCTYLWSGPAGFTSTMQDPFIYPSTLADAGEYHVIRTLLGVHDTDSTNVVIHPLPVVTATSNAPLCTTPLGTLDLFANPAGAGETFVWTGPDGFTSDLQDPTLPSFGPANTGIYKVVTLTNFGCTDSATTDAELIPPPPAPVVHGLTFYCQGTPFEPFVVTDSSGATIDSNLLWYPSATGGTSTSIPSVINTGIPGLYTVYVSHKVGSCEGPRGSFTVRVRTTPPAPLVTGVLQYCQYIGPYVPLTVHTTATGIANWYIAPAMPPSGTSTLSEPVPNIDVVPSSGEYTYYVTQTDSTCQGPPQTVNITIHPKPAPPVVHPQPWCQFLTSSPVSATSSGPTYSLLWYGPGRTVGTSSAPTPSTLVAPDTIDYYVTQTSSFGCVSDSALDAEIIIKQPAAPVTKDIWYCQGAVAAPLNAEVDSAASSTLQWYFDGAMLASAPVPPTDTTPGNTTWYVTQTVNSCQSDSASITVTLLYKPVFSITASQPAVCQFDSIYLEYNGPQLVAPSYTWTLPEGATFAAGTHVYDDSVVVNFDSAVLYNYVKLTVSDDSGKCTSDTSIRINIVSQPTAEAYTKPDVCLGDTVALALTSRAADANNYMWYVDYVPLLNTSALTIISSNSNSGGPYSISWVDSGRHIIEVVSYSGQEGCKSMPVYDTINVHLPPDAKFGITSKSDGACIDDSVQFTAETQDYNDSYEWTPEQSFENVNKPVAWGQVQAMTTITLTVTDPFGCVATESMNIDPGSCCTVGLPNAFTPNGDSKDDFFRPLYNGYHHFHVFQVVNRWGQVVFNSENSGMQWDGTYNGVPQDMGTYYYYLKYDCGGKTFEQKGDVTLIR